MIYKAFSGPYINRDNFVLVNNVLTEYNDMKKHHQKARKQFC